ncbi:hypothetical protein [Mangrovibacterium sp.]|uniref:hypothetical protein n=1 Tax=Mangrovibacterium sp. TaxID=1961364 RepID=UPI00356808AD
MSESGREMTKQDRIKRVARWLIGNGVAANQETLGRMLGYKNKSSFSQVLNGKVPIPTGFTNRLAKLDQRINEAWISEGWGSMIDEKLTEKNREEMYQEQITKDEKIIQLQQELERYKAIVDRLTGRCDNENKQTAS